MEDTGEDRRRPGADLAPETERADVSPVSHDEDPRVTDDGRDADGEDGADGADADDDGEQEEARPPDPWLAFEDAVRARHGVADTVLATTHGVARQRFFTRTRAERWQAPRPGVRLHPLVPASVQQDLIVALCSTGTSGGASGDTAAWLHGLRAYPPDRPSVLVRHGVKSDRHPNVLVHRARWLSDDEVTVVDGVPTLSVPAMLLSSCRASGAAQRARLIDVLHRRLATVEAIVALLDRCGPVPNKATLRSLCTELGPLAVESVFQDAVARTLLSLGYPADRSTRRIPTPDGIGLTIDIALADWLVSLEPEGDAFHRTRQQRRADRRRIAAYAATDWVPVPIDWRDWLLDRDHVLAAIDAAIIAQQRRGFGVHVPRPRRLPPTDDARHRQENAGRRPSDAVPSCVLPPGPDRRLPPSPRTR